MWGLVLSFVSSLYVLVSQQMVVQATLFQVFGLFFLASCLFALGVLWSSVRRNNEKVSPAAMTLCFNDIRFSLILIALFAFSIFSIIGDPSSKIGLVVWLLGFGISFDLTCFFFQRLRQYSDPLFLLEELPARVIHSLRKKEEGAALEWLNRVFEMVDRAIETHKFTLANRSVDTLRLMTEEYVQQLAWIELQAPPGSLQEGTSFLDKVTLLSMMVCEKLQWLYMRAIKKEMQPTIQAIASCFGKLSLFLSRHNTKAAALPLQYLSKCAISADIDALIQATLTLGQTCKSLLRLSFEKKESFKDLICSCLLNMEEMTKLVYQKDKESNVALLIQPFAEVAESLGTQEMQEVLGRAEILTELKRIFTQFESLQMVSSGISEVVAQDTSASFAQDIIKP
jgi:hypothetical protein